MPPPKLEKNAELEAVCEFLRENYMNTIRLDDLSALTGLSKYYLLRFSQSRKAFRPTAI